MHAGSSRMSGTSAEEEVGAREGGGDAVLTHVELTLNGCPAQIVEIGPSLS